MGTFDLETMAKARKLVKRRNGRIRELASYSLFVGEALGRLLQQHDKLQIRRDGNGDFRYSVRRQAESVLTVGSPAGCDVGEVVSVWQQYDEHPNPYAQQVREQIKNLPVAETLSVHRPYITTRIESQFFLLLDDDEVEVPPYFVYLARSNQKVPTIAFEFFPRAVHAMAG